MQDELACAIQIAITVTTLISQRDEVMELKITIIIQLCNTAWHLRPVGGAIAMFL